MARRTTYRTRKRKRKRIKGGKPRPPSVKDHNTLSTLINKISGQHQVWYDGLDITVKQEISNNRIIDENGRTINLPPGILILRALRVLEECLRLSEEFLEVEFPKWDIGRFRGIGKKKFKVTAYNYFVIITLNGFLKKLKEVANQVRLGEIGERDIKSAMFLRPRLIGAPLEAEQCTQLTSSKYINAEKEFSKELLSEIDGMEPMELRDQVTDVLKSFNRGMAGRTARRIFRRKSGGNRRTKKRRTNRRKLSKKRRTNKRKTKKRKSKKTRRRR